MHVHVSALTSPRPTCRCSANSHTVQDSLHCRLHPPALADWTMGDCYLIQFIGWRYTECCSSISRVVLRSVLLMYHSSFVTMIFLFLGNRGTGLLEPLSSSSCVNVCTRQVLPALRLTSWKDRCITWLFWLPQPNFGKDKTLFLNCSKRLPIHVRLGSQWYMSIHIC